MIAIDPNSTVEYVVRSDRALPDAEQTVWLLKPLTLREEGEIARALTEEPHKGGTLILRKGLRGWRNFKDPLGDEVPFDGDTKGEPSSECLQRIPLIVRSELASVIQLGCRLDEEERGK